MKIYKVAWRLQGGGTYIPDDPVTSGGGYYGDRTGIQLVTARKKNQAVAAVKNALPGCKIVSSSVVLDLGRE